MLKLIDYYADWCGPCHQMEPVLEELRPQYTGVIDFVKIDVDDPQHQPKVQAAGVMSIPTFVIEKDGEEIDRRLGATPKDVFKSWLDSHTA